PADMLFYRRAFDDSYGAPGDMSFARFHAGEARLFGRKETQEELDKAFESAENRVEVKKKDGSVVEMRDGFVHAIRKGSDSTAIEYQRDATGKVKLDGNGQPVVERITTNNNGVESTIDLSAGAKDAGFADLAKRIRVVQSGDAVGNVMIGSEDGKTISTLRTDFSTVTHELVSDGEKELSRVRQVIRADGSTTTYNYANDKQPTKITQIVEQYRTSMGTLVTQTSDRVGDTEKFVTHTDKNDKVKWRTDVKVSGDGNLAYKELVSNFFDGPREYSDLDLGEAREKFLKTAAANGVFKGDENTILSWMNKFESRCRRLSDRGWKAPTSEDLAESYRNLARVFTDEPTGNAKRVTRAERRLAVECELKELADPVRNINQGPVGTCALNSVEDSLAQRRPQDLTRWLREALTKGCVTSRGLDKSGHHRVVQLGANQIKYQPTYHRSYSNQLFQFAAMAALGYKSNGYDYPGTTNDQMNYVSMLASGKKIPILDNWMGYGARKQDIINCLKKGTVAYIVPGHAMAIDDYDPNTDRFLVNNWWGGSGDGWYSARRLGLR
ncbi:MAG TPA: hypothetical protein V6D17_20245, partial [Candidatus Obscuribacterales bacterium]